MANTRYVIYDSYKKENNGIHAIYFDRERALMELKRDDKKADGFYMITYEEEHEE